MTAAFLGAPAVGGDLESGVAYAILARPLRRTDVLVGRWLGCALVVVVYAVASGLLAIGVAVARVGERAALSAAGRGLPGRPGAGPAQPDPGARLRAALDRGGRDRGRGVRDRLDGRRAGRRGHRARRRRSRPGRRGEPLAAAERRPVARRHLRARAAARRAHRGRTRPGPRRGQPVLRRRPAVARLRRLVRRVDRARARVRPPGGSSAATCESAGSARGSGSSRARGRRRARRSA